VNVTVLKTTPSHLIFSEYHQFGNLVDILHGSTYILTEEELRFYAAELVLAVKYMHDVS